MSGCRSADPSLSEVGNIVQLPGCCRGDCVQQRRARIAGRREYDHPVQRGREAGGDAMVRIVRRSARHDTDMGGDRNRYVDRLA